MPSSSPKQRKMNNYVRSPARRSLARSPARPSPKARKTALKRLTTAAKKQRSASPMRTMSPQSRRRSSPSPRRRSSPSPRRRPVAASSPSPTPRRPLAKQEKSPKGKASWGAGKKKIAYTPVETSSGKIEYVRCCRKRRGSGGLGTLLGVGLGTGLGAGVGSRLGGTGGAIGGAVLGGLGGKLAADAFQGSDDETGCVQC